MSLFYSPLEGFKVIPIIKGLSWFDMSITNITLTAVLVMLFCTFFAVSLSFKRKLIPDYPQLLLESAYEASVTLVASAVGRRGMPFFPYLISLYYWLMFTNLLGGVPYSSVVTAQLVLTAGIGFSTFLGLVLVTVYHHKYYT